MRTIAAISLVLLGIVSMGLSFDNTDVPDIRADVHQNLERHSELERIFKSTAYPQNAVSSAYKGLARVLMAEEAFMPTTKLSYFQEGKSLIEQAIKNQPSNIEIRYVRLLVQSNAPSFLGYTSNLESDLNLFLSGIDNSQIPQDWKKNMLQNLLKTSGFSASQQKQIQTKISNFTTS